MSTTLPRPRQFKVRWMFNSGGVDDPDRFESFADARAYCERWQHRYNAQAQIHEYRATSHNTNGWVVVYDTRQETP